jgi:hypothetical protein
MIQMSETTIKIRHEVMERTDRILSLIRHGPDRKLKNKRVAVTQTARRSHMPPKKITRGYTDRQQDDLISLLILLFL